MTAQSPGIPTPGWHHQGSNQFPMLQRALHVTVVASTDPTALGHRGLLATDGDARVCCIKVICWPFRPIASDGRENITTDRICCAEFAKGFISIACEFARHTHLKADYPRLASCRNFHFCADTGRPQSGVLMQCYAAKMYLTGSQGDVHRNMACKLSCITMGSSSTRGNHQVSQQKKITCW